MTMTIALCAAVCLAGLCSALLLGGSTLLSLLAVLAAAGIAVLRLYLFKNNKIVKLVTPVASVALLVLCLFIPSRATAFGSADYSARLAAYEQAVFDEDGKKADALYRELTDIYGETDEMRYLRVMDALAKDEPGEARKLLDEFDDRRSVLYYSAAEPYTAVAYPEGEEGEAALRQLYKYAAGDNPEWFYAVRRAGIAYLTDGELEQAAYWLTRAYTETAGTDGEVCFFLGEALYGQGMTEQAMALFDEALDAGVDGQIKDEIADYRQEADGI